MAGKQESRVFVGGLPTSTKAHHLAEAFSRFGTVLETEIAMDRKTGRLRGFGFITFTNPHDARAAILHMHNTELHGQTITVSHAFPRISSYDEYNRIQDNTGTSGKHIYINSTFRKYGNNKNHISDYVPYEDCYSGNEGKRGNHHKSFRYYTPYKDCHVGGDDDHGKCRNNNETSRYSPPYNDCHGKKGNNSYFNYGHTGHWSQNWTDPGEDEFDNDYSHYHGRPPFYGNQFCKVKRADKQRAHGSNNRCNKKFNCGCTGYYGCSKQRDGMCFDPYGKRPQSPGTFDYGDYDPFGYDDFTIYCDNCDEFGHLMFDCPNLGGCSNSHPKFCDCDGGPYLHEARFDGPCMQCGGNSFWSVLGYTNSSIREHGESSHGSHFSGQRCDGRPKGCHRQYRSRGSTNFPNLGCSLTSHQRYCDCDGGPYLCEDKFDGSCMQCGNTLWSIQENLKLTREPNQSSCRANFSGNRCNGRPKGYYDQCRQSSGNNDFLNSPQKNSWKWDPFGVGSSSGEVSFHANDHLGKNVCNPSHGSHCQNSRGRNSKRYDAFAKDELFEKGGFENHGHQANRISRTMPPRAAGGGERSGSRWNRGRKNDQFERIDDENNRELHDGRGVHGQNAGSQSRANAPCPSRRVTGGSSRRPQDGTGGGNSARHGSRVDGNERRWGGKDPINVYVIVEQGGKS